MDKENNNLNIDLQDWIDALNDLSLLEGDDHAKNLIKLFLEHIDNNGFLPDNFNNFKTNISNHLHL